MNKVKISHVDHFEKSHLQNEIQDSFDASSHYSPYRRKRIMLSKGMGIGNPRTIIMSGHKGMPARTINKTGMIHDHLNFKKLTKKIGAGIKKGVKAVGKAGKAVGKSVANVVKAAVSWPVLIPFMPVMGAALKKKGLTPPKGIESRSTLFYNTFIAKKKGNFDTYVDTDTFEGPDRDHVLPLAIIPPIIAFIKQIVGKKKAGIKQDPSIEAAVSEAIPIIKKLGKDAGDIDETMPGSNMKVIAGETDESGVSEENLPGKGGISTKNKKKSKTSMGDLFKNPWVIAAAASALIILIALIMKRK